MAGDSNGLVADMGNRKGVGMLAGMPAEKVVVSNG